MGVNWDFPRAYRHVSKMFQMIDIPEIMVDQMIDMVS